jgi:hypothetical protein
MRLRRLLGLSLVAAVAAACSPSGGEIAQRIRDARSPLIESVNYRPQNILDPQERIDVLLKPGTTEAQADALWCEIVVPADGNGIPVVLWADSGIGDVMATNAICPAGSLG